MPSTDPPASAGPPASTGPANAAGNRRRWIALVIVCFAMLMNALDQTIVNVALPTIQRELGFSQAGLAWVVDAYLITFGGSLLLAGRLGDLIGRKKVFLSGIALFTLASGACGAADSPTTLVVARFVQGVGAAFSSSVIIAIMVAEFPEARERARAMSAYLFVAVGGGTIGLLAGGVLTEALNWHWIFLINLPIGVLTLALGMIFIDENVGIGIAGGVDVAGAVLSTAGMMLAIYAIVTASDDGWASAHTATFGGAAIALLAAFGARQATAANPLMPPRILRSRGLMISSLIRGLAFVGMYALFFSGALYLQNVLGYSTLRTGLAFLPNSVMVLVLSLGVTAWLTARLGPRRTASIGLAVAFVGLALFASAGEHTPYFPLLFLSISTTGLGISMSFLPLLSIAIADMAPRDAGLASGIVNVSLQLAGAVGVAVLGTIAAGRTRTLLGHGESRKAALTGGYTLAFTIGAASVGVAVLCLLVLLRTRRTAIPAAGGTGIPLQQPGATADR
jgi:EmrB/QacA subfamily drug resistance transporter